MIERDSGLRLKTIASNLDNPKAKLGDIVKVVGGSFDGWSGKLVELDGIWRTVQTDIPGGKRNV